MRKKDYPTVKQNPEYSDRQWHGCLRHASEGLHQGTWRLSIGTLAERLSVSAIIGEGCAVTLVILIRGCQEKLPDYQKVRKVIESSIENFDPMVAVTQQKSVPSIEFSTVKGNLEREQEVEDTMLDLLQQFAEGL